MKNVKRSAGIIIAVILLVGIVGLLSGCGEKPETEAMTGAEATEQVHTISAFGVVKAPESQNMTLDFPAGVEKVLVKEGQKVKKGDLLAALDLTVFKGQLESKEMELDMARKDLSQLEVELEKIQNNLEAARKNLEQAQRDLSSQEQLKNAGAIPVVEFFNLKNAVFEQEKNLNNLELSAQNLQNNEMGIARGKITLLQEDIARMQQQQSKSFLDGTNLISDIENGLISGLAIHNGDSLAAGQTLLNVVDMDSLIIEAEVAEEFILDLQVGDTVSIVPLANRTEQYEGTVKRISDQAIIDKGETVVPVEITLNQKEAALLPGFNVDVEINK